MLSRFFATDAGSFFDAFERQIEQALDRSALGSRGQAPDLSNAKTTFVDTGDAYVLRAVLPGVSKQDVEITLEGSLLTVKAERKDALSANYKIVRRERGSLKFAQQLELGTAIDLNAVEATLEQGILQVKLPKIAPARPRKIEVTGSSSATVAHA